MKNCFVKYLFKRMKRQMPMGKKYLQNRISNNLVGLVCRRYKELSKLSVVKKINNPTKKWAKDMSGHFTKEWQINTENVQYH